MPIRAAVAGDAASIATCINAMYGYLRTRNALLDGVVNWTAATVTAWGTAGYRAYVYATASNRIDSVCIYGIENHDRGGGMEPWMAIKILAVRAGIVADTPAEHERYSLRALKLAIPNAVTVNAVVGVVAEHDARWTRLDTFFGTWRSGTPDNVREVSPDGTIVRHWVRVQPGLPEFTTRTASV